MKLYICIILALACACKTPSATKTTQEKNNVSTINNFKFDKITFFSGYCFGSCPNVKMNILPDGKLELSRQSTKGKGAPDMANSGNYTQQLSNNEYSDLISLFQKINWDTITFKKEFCCDAPIRTFILSYDGKQKQFSSMFPPEETNDLTEKLMELVISPKLKKYPGEFVFDKTIEE